MTRKVKVEDLIPRIGELIVELLDDEGWDTAEAKFRSDGDSNRLTLVSRRASEPLPRGSGMMNPALDHVSDELTALFEKLRDRFVAAGEAWKQAVFYIEEDGSARVKFSYSEELWGPGFGYGDVMDDDSEDYEAVLELRPKDLPDDQ